jgi:transcriptional regulator with GAF, ATPase, and Fis domain
MKIWREACRHIAIGESTETMASILRNDMPLEQVFVRRIDPQQSCVETVAAELAAGEHLEPGARTDCSNSRMQKLLAWCRLGKVVRRRRGAPLDDGLEPLVPAEIGAEVLVGPLGDPGGLCGALVLAAPADRPFTDRHVALTQVLLEPFSVALANDRQLRELSALREAAEAEKRSLLARLGRKELGDTIVGVESGLHAVIERVDLVAQSNAPVLIFGETGTGKELIARAIHARSRRAAGPFIRTNCGAIPAELVDSQLFGHERGAFTGAVEMRKGWFERADGGTLLLDEVAELPPAAQVRLLRILQDGWLERVGGHQPIHVDVRIVAATHRDLARMVAEGKFREDLWYRLAVFPIVLPPLRERPEDVSELARHFAERAAARFGLPLALPSPEDAALLKSYPWPGNVRELAAVIDRAAILGNGNRLEVAKALGVAATGPGGLSGNAVSASGPSALRPEILPLDAAIRRHIEVALAATKGRIEGPHGAALLLKINPHTLRAKMRKLGIDWAAFRD